MSKTRKRTFNGCLTCRKRKVKCNENYPCSSCLRLGLDCQSPFENNLRITILDSCDASMNKNRKSDRPSQGPLSKDICSSKCLSIKDSNSFKKKKKTSTCNNQSFIVKNNNSKDWSTMTSVNSLARPSALIDEDLTSGQLSSGNPSLFSNKTDKLKSVSNNHDISLNNSMKLSDTSNHNYYDSNIPDINCGSYTQDSYRDIATYNYTLAEICETNKNEACFDIMFSSNTSNCPSGVVEKDKKSHLDIQYDTLASSIIENAFMNFNNTVLIHFGIENLIGDIEIIILSTSVVFCFCEQSQDYKSLIVRANQFCSWVLPFLCSLPIVLSPNGCKIIMYIFYTSMRIYLLSPQINHDLIRIFQQREVIAMLSVKANMVVISPDKENLTLENWICSTENNLTNHSQKFPRIMFIFGDIMNLRESYIEDMKPSIILEIEREIKILESELCTEALQQDKKQIDDFHWITDYLLLDSAVILFRRIVISSTTFDVTSVAKANHILHLALLIKRADYQKSSYYYMWPIALVLAAIELEDEVKRDWIQTFISNIVKKRSSCTNGLLLFIREACRRQSNSPKIKIDIFEVINDYKIEIMV